MKTLYTLEVTWYNGSVTMGNEITSYTTRELAEKAKAAVEKANRERESIPVEPVEIYKDSGLITVSPQSSFVPPVICSIKETKVYENESEVPILNHKEDVDSKD